MSRLLFACVLWFSCTAVADSTVDSLLKADRNGDPVPRLSRLEHDATLNRAYQVQKAIVAAHDLQPVGFKAGLTSPVAWPKFDVSAPIAGVLLRPPITAAQPIRIDSTQYQRLMLEMELGFRLKEPVDKPVQSITALKALVAEVAPVIELPELGFSKGGPLKGLDVVAANCAARQFIVGPAHDMSLDPNALRVELEHDRTVVLKGQGSDALGDQWQALQWLVNHSLEQGYVLSPEQWMITGALGKMLPGELGRYRADFGELGVIEFHIVD